MQIEERVVERAARADLMAADDVRHAHHHAADALFVEHHAVGEDRRGLADDLEAGPRDEHRDQERADRIERSGYPKRTATSDTSTAHVVRTSLRVCSASAISSSLCSARARAAS